MALLLFVFSGQLSAQNNKSFSNFKIQDFEWVDDKDLALFLNGGFDLNSQINDAYYINFSSYSKYTYTPFSYNLLLNPILEFEYKILPYELYIQIPLDLSYAHGNSVYPRFPYDRDLSSYYYYSYRNEIGKAKSDSYSVMVTPFIEYKKYFYDYFAGIDIQYYLNGSYENYQTESKINTTGQHSTIKYSTRFDENYSQRQDQFLFNHIQGILKFGIGRKYSGKYAYQAMQLIDDLNKDELLNKTVDSIDMQKLSKIISEEKQKYIWDNREKAKNVCLKISRFLLSNGYIASNKLESYYTIFDSYNYLPEYDRDFGKVFNIRIGSDFFSMYDYSYSTNYYYSHNINYSNQIVTSDSDYTYSTLRTNKVLNIGYSFFVGGEMNHYIPISQKWQFDYSYSADFYIIDKGELYPEYAKSIVIINDLKKKPHLQHEFHFVLKLLASSRFYTTLANTTTFDYYKVNYEHQLSDPSTYPGTDIFVLEHLQEYKELFAKDIVALNCYYNLYYNLVVNIGVDFNYVYRKRSDYKIKGSYLEYAYPEIQKELDTFFKDLNPIQNYNFNIYCNLSYRLF